MADAKTRLKLQTESSPSTKWLWFLIFLYLVAFPFGQFTRLPLELINFPEIRVYLTDILVGVIGMIGATKWFVGKNHSNPLGNEILGFLLIVILSLLLTIPRLESREVLVSSLYLLRLFAYGLFYITICNLIKTTKEHLLIRQSLILIGIMMAFFGWLGYFLFPDIRSLLNLGWDEHYQRIIGTFLDPNFLGIILVLALISVVFNFLKKKNFNWILLLGFLFLTLLFTYSRSSYLAFLAGMGTISLIFRQPRFLMIPAVLLLAGIFLLPRPDGEGVRLERTASNMARLENWQESLQFVKESPLFGVGFNTLRFVRERQGLLNEKYGVSHASFGVDNSFLFVLATTGIVGLITFLSLLVKISKTSPVILSSIIAVSIHSLFNNSLFYPWVMGWLILLLSTTSKSKNKS